MALMLPLRGPVNCFRCGTPLVLPEWSETVDDGKTTHIWHCFMCSHEFETTDSADEKSSSTDDELLHKFLHKLLVA